MKISVIGSINKDIVLSVENIVAPGETIQALEQNEYLGGKGYNQAVAVSKAYNNSAFYCSLNKNDTEIINRMNQNNFLPIIQESTTPTGTAFIQVDKSGENSIVICKNANNEINLTEVYGYINTLEKEDIIVLQNEINDLENIISYASKKGIKIVLNPSPITETITTDLIKDIDMMVLNQHELNSITSKQSFEDSLQYINRHYPKKEFVITLGEQGAMYVFNKNIIRQESFKVNVVDTTCAGDTFLGYFLGHYAQNYPIETCLYYGSKAASICVSRPGASTSIPDISEVK